MTSLLLMIVSSDAAHTVHPLAGQGLNQGILDVACLSDILQRGASEGQDIGNLHLLREYASVRYLRNLLMISACDKLHRLYSTDFAPITWIRSLGLSSVNQLDFVKVSRMRQYNDGRAKEVPHSHHSLCLETHILTIYHLM